MVNVIEALILLIFHFCRGNKNIRYPAKSLCFVVKAIKTTNDF